MEDGAGIRKTHYKPKEGVNCIIHPNPRAKADGEVVDNYVDEGSHWFASYSYVYQEVSIQNCNIFEDLSSKSPLLKLISFVLAIITALFAVCMLILCLSYCKLS